MELNWFDEMNLRYLQRKNFSPNWKKINSDLANLSKTMLNFNDSARKAAIDMSRFDEVIRRKWNIK